MDIVEVDAASVVLNSFSQQPLADNCAISWVWQPVVSVHHHQRDLVVVQLHTAGVETRRLDLVFTKVVEGVGQREIIGGRGLSKTEVSISSVGDRGDVFGSGVYAEGHTWSTYPLFVRVRADAQLPGSRVLTVYGVGVDGRLSTCRSANIGRESLVVAVVSDFERGVCCRYTIVVNSLELVSALSGQANPEHCFTERAVLAIATVGNTPVFLELAAVV